MTTNEINVPLRHSEWRCKCYARNIRAASVIACIRCGMERPVNTEDVIIGTWDAVVALDLFKQEVANHGNELSAMDVVLDWARWKS